MLTPIISVETTVIIPTSFNTFQCDDIVFDQTILRHRIKAIRLFFVLIIGLFVLIFRCINFFPLQIMTQEIPNAILYIVRFFIATLMAMVVFETTSAIEIINSLSNFHNLFAKKIPFLRKWNFLLILALSINFIPQIFFVWEQLRVAAKARTFTGNCYNFIEKIRILIAQFSGVVSCMLQRSNEIRKIVISKS